MKTIWLVSVNIAMVDFYCGDMIGQRVGLELVHAYCSVIEDQPASFELLVNFFGRGPPTAGQPGTSALMVGGPKSYNTMVQDNPGKNTYQAPPAEKTINRNKNEKRFAERSNVRPPR